LTAKLRYAKLMFAIGYIVPTGASEDMHFMDRMTRKERLLQVRDALRHGAGGPDLAVPVSVIAKWVELKPSIYLRALLDDLIEVGQVGFVEYDFPNGTRGRLYYFAGKGNGNGNGGR